MTNTPATKLHLVKIVKQNGKYPLKLRVTCNRIQKFYPCNIELTKEEFLHIFYGAKLKKADKDIRDTATGIEVKANAIIAKMRTFDFATFEKKFYNLKSNQGDVYQLFGTMYDELLASDRIGSAVMYKTVENSLKLYKPVLAFAQITPTFLNNYEAWLIKENEKGKTKTITTVGIYMRHLRSVYNRAISENLAAKEDYPFGRNKYIPPTGNNIKKALSLEEVGRIFTYPTAVNGWEKRAKDFWCFSYLCNGMNITDILQLKFGDISGGEIHYQRAKTFRTNIGKSSPLISIPILTQTQTIIDTWGNPNVAPEEYVFPFLVKDFSAKDVKQCVAQFTKNMNKYIKRISKDLKIEKHVTTYVARHSFATVLKRSGASDEAISENLGHKLVSTTKSYLGSFESESRMKNAQALVAFLVQEELVTSAK